MTAGKTLEPVPGDRVRHGKHSLLGTVVAPPRDASGKVALSRTPVIPDGACTVSYWDTRHLTLVPR